MAWKYIGQYNQQYKMNIMVNVSTHYSHKNDVKGKFMKY